VGIKQKSETIKGKNSITAFLKKRFSCKSIVIKRISPASTIFLSGSGRSGTTWLSNIIGACPGVGILFEPFDHRKVPEAKHFSLRTYLRPGEEYPRKKVFIKQVLSWGIHNAWIDCENKNFLVWKALVKSIRANLMLAWIDRNFHCPILYMVRHPCAVVLSRLKLNWETHLEVFLGQEKLMKDYLSKFESSIRKAKKPIHKHAIMWCIENLITLNQLPNYNWTFCSYEELCINTEEEIDRIFSRLGLKRTARVNQALNSFYQTRNESAVRTGKDPVSEWKNQLSKQDVADILAIVHDFEIKIYGESPLPVTGYLQKVNNHA